MSAQDGMPALQQILDALDLPDSTLVAAYLLGSRLWGSHSASSDYDVLLIVGKSTRFEGKNAKNLCLRGVPVDASVCDLEEFCSRIKSAKCPELLCLLAPHDCILFETDTVKALSSNMELDLTTLRNEGQSLVEKDWKRARELIERGDLIRGKKIVCHALRYLALFAQLAETIRTSGSLGKANINVQSFNEVHEQLRCTYARGWSDYEKQYGAIRERLLSILTGKNCAEGPIDLVFNDMFNPISVELEPDPPPELSRHITSAGGPLVESGSESAWIRHLLENADLLKDVCISSFDKHAKIQESFLRTCEVEAFCEEVCRKLSISAPTHDGLMKAIKKISKNEIGLRKEEFLRFFKVFLHSSAKQMEVSVNEASGSCGKGRPKKLDRGNPNSSEVGYKNEVIMSGGLESIVDMDHADRQCQQESTPPKRPPGAIPLCIEKEALALTVQIEDVATDLMPMLEAHGCAIVVGVASEDECRHLETLFAEDLADLIDKAALSRAGNTVKNAAEDVAKDAKSWPEASMKLLGEKDRCQLRGLPHGRFAWECRLLPNVRQCYETIHGQQDLVSSCDNTFFAPPSRTQEVTNKLWPHVDQNLYDDRYIGDECVPVGQWDVYQGILYVWSSQSSHASTTVVLPGSHREMYYEMMQKSTFDGSNFCLLSKLPHGVRDSLESQWDIGARRIPVPRGSLLLWSSRTLHQGWTGGPRLAQPVCWEPSTRRDSLALDRKLRLAALGLPSTHSASLGHPHNLVEPEPCKATPASSIGHEVLLPARASIHLSSLRPDVDVSDMWKRLVGWPWEKPLPAELRDFLIGCLSDRIYQAL